MKFKIIGLGLGVHPGLRNYGQTQHLVANLTKLPDPLYRVTPKIDLVFYKRIKSEQGPKSRHAPPLTG